MCQWNDIEYKDVMSPKSDTVYTLLNMYHTYKFHDGHNYGDWRQYPISQDWLSLHSSKPMLQNTSHTRWPHILLHYLRGIYAQASH